MYFVNQREALTARGLGITRYSFKLNLTRCPCNASSVTTQQMANFQRDQGVMFLGLISYVCLSTVSCGICKFRATLAESGRS